jgi:putative tryptophan/tyrosine transport system substrate-binding protein
MKKYFVILILIVFIFSCNKDDGKIKIGFVQLFDEPNLDSAREGVIKALEENGFVNGENIHIDFKSAQGELHNIPLILQTFISNNVDLIITSTTPCMAAAAKTVKNIPVVFTVSFGPVDAGIEKTPDNLTGCYDPFELNLLMDLITEIIPNLNNIGLPYNPSEVNAQFAASKIKAIAKERGIRVSEMPVSNIIEIPNAAQALATKGVDIFIVSADNTIYTGLGAMLKVANDYKIPIFVSDPIIVHNGAAVGFGIDYYKWGYESGKIASKVLQGTPVSSLPPVPYKKYQLFINTKSAAEQGLNITDNIMKRADYIK